jgi:hypothetical protein
MFGFLLFLVFFALLIFLSSRPGSHSAITIKSSSHLSTVASELKGFRTLTVEHITSTCNFKILAFGSFERKLGELGFELPQEIPEPVIQEMTHRLNLSILVERLLLEVGRRSLVSSILQPMLAQFSDHLKCFQEHTCTSSLLHKKGPVDFLIGTYIPKLGILQVKVFVAECKSFLLETNIDSHLAQWVGELSAAMNGGDYSQGVLTDGCSWLFGILTHDAPAVAVPGRQHGSSKPRLSLYVSRFIKVIEMPIDTLEVNVDNLRLVYQYLHACFNCGRKKMAGSHLLVLDEPDEPDELDEAISNPMGVLSLSELDPAVIPSSSSSSAPAFK